MTRSQRHVRYTQGQDSTGDGRYPGDDYEWDWANTWPSGSGAVLPPVSIGDEFLEGLPDGLTLTRAGAATMVNSLGQIVEVPADTPRTPHYVNGVNEGILIESDEATNEAWANQTYVGRNAKDAAWADSAVDSPIGPDTGILWSDNGNMETGTVWYQWNNVDTANDWYTWSVYVKNVPDSSLEFVQLRIESNPAGTTTYRVRLTDMTLYNAFPSDGSTIGGVEDTGFDGWHRIWISRILGASTGTTDFRLTMATESTSSVLRDGTQQLYVVGDQVEVGKYPTSLILTSGVPVTRAGDVLTIEPADFPFPEETTSNYFPLSEDYHTSVTKANVSTVADVTTAPDGTTTADQCIENADNAGHWLSRNFVDFEAGNQYCMSQYWKANERSHAQIIFTSATFGETITAGFELTGDGTAVCSDTGTDVMYGIEPAGDGWYRCWLSARCLTSAASAPQLRIVNALSSSAAGYQGDGSSSVYIWGGQLEERASPSRYIPTGDVTPVTVTSAQMPQEFSTAIEGKFTFEDKSLVQQVVVYEWLVTSQNYFIDGVSTNVDARLAARVFETVGTTVFGAGPAYTTGYNIPYNWASRNTPTELQVADSGTSSTVGDAAGMPDLVSASMGLGPRGFTGTIKRFRFWDEDIGEHGIINAT